VLIFLCHSKDTFHAHRSQYEFPITSYFRYFVNCTDESENLLVSGILVQCFSVSFVLNSKHSVWKHKNLQSSLSEIQKEQLGLKNVADGMFYSNACFRECECSVQRDMSDRRNRSIAEILIYLKKLRKNMPKISKSN
jgi:hypothetical protein